MKTQPFQTKLKKGDEVIVLTGKDKGKTGTIETVLTKANKVVVGGLNTVKRHVTARMAAMQQRESGIDTKEMPLAISNVALKDPKTGKATKVAYATNKAGEKVRVAKASGTELDVLKKVKKA